MGKTKIQWTDELRARFRGYVRQGEPDACWEWIAGCFSDGMRYGQFRAGKRKLKAHRVAYELAVGEIPEGKRILHSCDNPLCCNPAHLRPGTDAENSADRVARGRQKQGRIVSLPGALNPSAKLTEERVADIRAAAASGEPSRSIAARTGMSPSQIRNIVQGRCWRTA